MSNKLNLKIERCLVFDETQFTVVREDENGCISCCSKVSINPGVLGLTNYTFEYVLTGMWAADINGAGLNLTGILPTYTNAPNAFLIGYQPFQVFMNGQRLSISEYTLVSGVLEFVGVTTASENDNITIDVLNITT